MSELDQRRKYDDILTLASVGILAYLAADLTHHVLGHAVACMALGGRIISITSVHVTCTLTNAAIDIAGPAANLAIGTIALLCVLLRSGQSVSRLFWLELAAFNLFWVEGQLVYSAAARTDDWAQLISLSNYASYLSVGLIVLGAACYLATIRLIAFAGRDFAAPNPRRLGRIGRAAWIAAGATGCLTALRDPAGLHAVLDRAAPQALLLPLGLFFLRPRLSNQPQVPIVRNRPLILTTSVLLIVSVAILGPGLK